MIARAVILTGCLIALLTEGLPGLGVFAGVFTVTFTLLLLAHRAWHQ